MSELKRLQILMTLQCKCALLILHYFVMMVESIEKKMSNHLQLED